MTESEFTEQIVEEEDENIEVVEDFGVSDDKI
jgi:hypothetical protein